MEDGWFTFFHKSSNNCLSPVVECFPLPNQAEYTFIERKKYQRQQNKEKDWLVQQQRGVVLSA